jgi:hypothetical protein
LFVDSAGHDHLVDGSFVALSDCLDNGGTVDLG